MEIQLVMIMQIRWIMKKLHHSTLVQINLENKKIYAEFKKIEILSISLIVGYAFISDG